MANCARTLTYPKHPGTSHESGQDHRHHDSCDSQYPALRSFFHLACLCLLLCVFAQPVAAQDPQDDADVVRVNTDLLLFPIRIRDKKGQAVAGLTEQDLTVKDDDKVTTGVYFAP